MTSSGGNPLLHPVRYWRHWVVCLGCVAGMVYGSQPVADATGRFAVALAYIAVLGVFMAAGLHRANRRVG
jgi:hypothetical protein